MALKFGIGSKKSVGIDIGSDSIKVIELSKSGHKYYIDVLDVIDLPSGAFSGGIINDALLPLHTLKVLLRSTASAKKK